MTAEKNASSFPSVHQNQPKSTSQNGSKQNQNIPDSTRQKLIPESSDFKLVFISSSDSNKDSDQLNSSLENNQSGEWDYEVKPPTLPPKQNKQHHGGHNRNLNFPAKMAEPFLDHMSVSTETTIRTAATRDRLSPNRQSPRIPKIREIPVQKAPSTVGKRLFTFSVHLKTEIWTGSDQFTFVTGAWIRVNWGHARCKF